MPDNCPILEARGIKEGDLKGNGICLNCPLEKCIYDEHRGKEHYHKKLRDQEIIRLFTTEGKRRKELALMFNITQRTVNRAIKSSRSKKEV